MERALAAGGDIDQTAQDGNILRFKGVSSRPKQVERLSIQEQDRFLRFMDDQLGGCVEVLAGVFPYKGTVIALVFDDLSNISHAAPPSARFVFVYFYKSRGVAVWTGKFVLDKVWLF